jgi:L-asparaginase II
MSQDGALVVEVTRGATVESIHRVAAVVVSASGDVAAAWGDPGRPTFPRSAMKPVQALPLVETGAADRFSLTSREIALAAASHGGEPRHVGLARAWLKRIGLGARDLECGAHRPIDERAADALAAEGRQPTALHNNCSGKHLGLLTTALHMGEPTEGYIRPEHPVERRLLGAIAEMTGADLAQAPRGIDGCGIPVVAVPLAALALAFARMAAPESLSPARADSCRRILAAMVEHPHLVGGRDRFDTQAIQALGGRAILKGGAEGVQGAIVPARGLGIALKAEDGAKRAACAAMAWLLRWAGVLDAAAEKALAAHLEAPVLNAAGANVGRVRVRADSSLETRAAAS